MWQLSETITKYDHSAVTQAQKQVHARANIIETHTGWVTIKRQEGLAVASIAWDDPSTLPGDDPVPCARMHCDRNVR